MYAIFETPIPRILILNKVVLTALVDITFQVSNTQFLQNPF